MPGFSRQDGCAGPVGAWKVVQPAVRKAAAIHDTALAAAAVAASVPASVPAPVAVPAAGPAVEPAVEPDAAPDGASSGALTGPPQADRATITGETMKLHERLTFDLARGQVLDGPRRYLLMRTDVLMGAFDGLEPLAREAALRALGRSVCRFGSDSVRAYRAEHGDAALLTLMEAAAASLGWGRWALRFDGERLELEVVNSPFAAGATVGGAPACHAIAGMLEAVARACWDGQVTARETRCACEAAPAGTSCRFVAAPVAARAAAGVAPGVAAGGAAGGAAAG